MCILLGLTRPQKRTEFKPLFGQLSWSSIVTEHFCLLSESVASWAETFQCTRVVQHNFPIFQLHQFLLFQVVKNNCLALLLYYFRHRSKYVAPTYPPRIDLATFCSNKRLLFCNTSAASLFKGSSGFGSWNTEKTLWIFEVDNCNFIPLGCNKGKSPPPPILTMDQHQCCWAQNLLALVVTE